MKTCPKCQALNNDANKFCEICGEALEISFEETTVLTDAPAAEPQPAYQAPVQPAYQAPAQPAYQAPAQPAYQAPVQPAYQAPVQPAFGVAVPINEDMLPEELKPVSVGAFMGYQLLFCIPLVGFIMLLVTAFGSGKKSMKNFAKSILLWQVIGVGLAIVYVLLVAIAFGF